MKKHIMKHIAIVAIAFVSLLVSIPISQAHAINSIKNASVTQKVAAKSSSVAKKVDAAPVVATPTPAPVTPPPDPTPAPQPVYTATGTCASYSSLFAQYDWPVQTAIAICQAESGGNPNSVSNASINYDGVSDFGLMQLHGLDILDPSANVAYAYYHKFLPARSFGPWSTYTSGRYLRFMQ